MPERKLLASRADLCRFLAACYYQPGPEFAEEKVFDSMLDVATRIRPDLAARARRLGEEFAAASTESLLVDYTRLFFGPVNAIAQPYGSIWLDAEKTVMGSSTMAVLDMYGQGGFEMEDDFQEPPDHIAAELEFLYLLIFRENAAHRNGRSDALTTIAGLRKRFLDEHLGRWVGPFTAAVKVGAQSAFYRELAALTDRFVGMEADSAKSN
ncbi:MAG: molecular chaperone TorD family protein [Betaproteobacteria bacterium]|nr:molecular chaperone TorD family protein [Betaproteobacteria bacterium]